MEALVIFLGALLCDNFLLTRLFGVESFFTATEKPVGAALYGCLVTGVTVISGSAVIALYKFVFVPLDITFLVTFAAVMVITAITCAVQLISSKISKRTHSAVEAAIPMVSSNCIILGSVLICIENQLSFAMSVVYLLAAGLGFTLAMLIFCCVQKRLANTTMAESFRGIPILLLSAAIAAMAFSGFYGLSF